MKFEMLRYFLLLIVCLSSVSALSAQTNNQFSNWNSLKSYLSEEIAIKIKNQKTVFGVLREISDGELKIQIVKKNYSNDAVVSRTEIEKIWSAQLRFGRNTFKGAGVGAGAGAGIGLTLALSTLSNKDSDGLAGALVPILAVYGAGVGGVVGFFNQKKHKKEKLVYQN